MRDAATAARVSRPLAAAGWVGGAVLSFALMAVAGRELSRELDTFEIMFYRSAIGFPLVLGALLWFEGVRGARTERSGAHAVRNVVHFAAQNLWFYGVATIPLAQLVALEFTNPLWVALLAPLMLGERLTRLKLAAALLGFAGVLVIARPGVSPLEWGHAAGLGAALGFAITNMMTRKLSARDSILCVVFWMTASQMAMGFVTALPGGITVPSAALAPWTILMGFLGLSAHYSLTRALTLADASVVAPMEFVRLPVIAAIGLMLYGEPLTAALFLGAAMILGANAMTIAEGRRRGG